MLGTWSLLLLHLLMLLCRGVDQDKLARLLSVVARRYALLLSTVIQVHRDSLLCHSETDDIYQLYLQQKLTSYVHMILAHLPMRISNASSC